jgi:hypothetical protein
LRHYYAERLLSPDFWRKVLTLRWRPVASLGHLARYVGQLMGPRKGKEADDWRRKPLPERMLYGLDRFPGQNLVLLSGRDLTAQEFQDTVAGSSAWQAWVARQQVRWQTLPEADHTFSRRVWTDRVSSLTAEWLESW